MKAQPLVHFNEVDECAGLDAWITNRVQQATNQPVETTLHDVRWADADRSGTTKEYVWVFEISGSAPPAHFEGGWAGAEGFRQPAMYFPNGGSTLRGISKPGEIVWSRIYVENDELAMDIGRGAAISLPREETERRWNATTPAVADHACRPLRRVARPNDGPAQIESCASRLLERCRGGRPHAGSEGGNGPGAGTARKLLWHPRAGRVVTCRVGTAHQYQDWWAMPTLR